MIWLIVIWVASGLAGWWLFEKSLLMSRGEVTMMDRSFVVSLALLGPACLLVGVLSMVSAKWPEDRVLRTSTPLGETTANWYKVEMLVFVEDEVPSDPADFLRWLVTPPSKLVDDLSVRIATDADRG